MGSIDRSRRASAGRRHALRAAAGVTLCHRAIIHILTGNEVTSVRLFPRRTWSDQKRDLFPKAEIAIVCIVPKEQLQ